MLIKITLEKHGLSSCLMETIDAVLSMELFNSCIFILQQQSIIEMYYDIISLNRTYG